MCEKKIAFKYQLNIETRPIESIALLIIADISSLDKKLYFLDNSSCFVNDIKLGYSEKAIKFEKCPPLKI